MTTVGHVSPTSTTIRASLSLAYTLLLSIESKPMHAWLLRRTSSSSYRAYLYRHQPTRPVRQNHPSTW